MTKIKPFSALVFNPKKVSSLGNVVCPPYDVISGQQQEIYHRKDPHNYIRIILGKDVPGEDKYRRAARLLRKWQQEGVLCRDKVPAFYFYSQKYLLHGEVKVRVGFLGLIKLENTNSAVFGHEHTRMEAKEDRFRLIKQVKANLSPIFAVFPDKKKLIAGFARKYTANGSCDASFTDDAGVEHKMWRVSDPKALKAMQTAFSREQIFIADGHHRYEVSCAYRQEMRRKHGNPRGAQSYDYTLAYFTGADPKGLSILPIHRLVKTVYPDGEKKFLEELKAYFDLRKVSGSDKLFKLMSEAKPSAHPIGLYLGGRYWLLSLKDPGIAERMMADKPKEYRMLDVSILNQLVFRQIMGLMPETKDALKYSEQPAELAEAVDKGQGSMAFFLRPVLMEQIIKVALKGEKMPAKSTFFYPKLISGLVINKH